jgi:hypothetical protein
VGGRVLCPVVLGWQEFTLSEPDKVRRAQDEEAVVIARRLDVLQQLIRDCDRLPEETRGAMRQQYIASMISGIASPEEWANYYRSLWHTAFGFWNALAPEHKVGKNLLGGVAWAYELINGQGVTKADLDALELAIRVVSQEDALKNSSGQSGQAATQPTDIRSTEVGPQSTPTS